MHFTDQNSHSSRPPHFDFLQQKHVTPHKPAVRVLITLCLAHTLHENLLDSQDFDITRLY